MSPVNFSLKGVTDAMRKKDTATEATRKAGRDGVLLESLLSTTLLSFRLSLSTPQSSAKSSVAHTLLTLT